MAMSEIKEIIPARMRHPHDPSMHVAEGINYPDETGAAH
jgi:hypothetical protein